MKRPSGFWIMVMVNENESVVREHQRDGFSLIELILSLVLTLIILGVAVTVFSSALGSRTREGSTTDAITSAQAALNIMSREIGNSGFGLVNNGIVLADSNGKKLRIRANTNNQNGATDGPGEDVQFFYDSASLSVVRYDKNVPTTSGVVNRVSDVDFVYTDYDSFGNETTGLTVPSANTGKVTILLKVILPDVQGQPAGRIEQVKSDVTLRNSTSYLLNKY